MWKKIVLIGIGTVMLLCVCFYIIGVISTADYHGEVKGFTEVNAKVVWNEITNMKNVHNKRHGIVKIVPMPLNTKGFPQWKEYTDMGGYIIFDTEQMIPYKLLTIKMVKTSFNMTGTWTYKLEPLNNGTSITIIENSYLQDPWINAAMLLAGKDANLRMEMKILLENLKGNR